MPRNGSGFYTLPSGNPVAPATIIESDWANDTMSDIAVQLNNVLTRDGLLGPTVAFKVIPGAAATPGLVANAYPSSGFYWDVGKIGASINGVSIGTIESDGLHMPVFGNLTGNVTGNLTGNVTGNVTGTVTGHSSLDVLKAGDTMTGALNITPGAAVALNLTRTTGGLIQEHKSSHASQGTYDRWSYNSGSNTQGYVGGSDQLITTPGSPTNFTLRAENVLELTIAGTASVGYAQLAAGGFSVGGSIIASLIAANRGVLTVNGPSDAVIGLGIAGVAKGNMYSNGTDMSLTNQAAGNLLLGTNSSSKWAIDSSGRFFTNGITPSASAMEIFGASNSLVIRGGSSGGYQGMRIYNDLNSASRGMEMDYSGSAYGSAILANGPSGEQGTLSTTGNIPLTFGSNNTARLGMTGAGVVNYYADNGSTALEVGFRGLNRVTYGSGASTLQQSDNGKCHYKTDATNVTVPSTLADATIVTIYNASGSARTIVQGAGLTMTIAGTSTTGNRTLAANGFANIWIVGGSSAIISGPGVT